MRKKLLLLALSILWAISAWAQNPDSIPFASAVNYGAGDTPYSIFCADLDGDGDLDLAVTNAWSNNVSILKNNGDGTFQPKVDYAAGEYPCSIFCADLDGDGDLDLAVGNSWSHTVSILKNNGDGTFQPKVDYSVYSPLFIFCADLDGDGDLDIAVANYAIYSVSILKNNGDGTFQPEVDYEVSGEPWSIFCADLDGDGDLDIAVANVFNRNVSILKNNGDGTFQPKVDYATGESPQSIFCADLDSDTDLDLAVANYESGNVSILKNNGDGTFQPKVDYSVYRPLFIFCADLDGDGDLDLALASESGVIILENLTQAPANQPPWAFSLISPLDQDTILGPTTFRWQAPYDPNFGDQIRYDLYVSTVPGFDADSTGVYDSLPLAKFTEALNNDTYYWKVKAYDNWGAERWSTQTWSFTVDRPPGTLRYIAYSPVDLIVTSPNGDSIGMSFNSIIDAVYDSTIDVNMDGDSDDVVTIPHPFAGDYQIRVVREPYVGPEDTAYTLGIRVNGDCETYLAVNATVPPPGEVIIYSYEVLNYLRGDANRDEKRTVGDAIYLINYLFKGGTAPAPLQLGDANCCQEGEKNCKAVSVSVSDVIYLINYLFKGGPAPCS